MLALLVYGYSTGIFFSRKLEMATEMKLLKLSTVCLDGTKIHANASRHSALSHGHIVKFEARQKETGEKPGGRPPAEPEPGVKQSDQINLTDEKLRIMKVSGGDFEHCYNAQAGVDAATMLVVATTLTQAPNDKQQVQPMLKVLQEQAPSSGRSRP